MKKLSQSKSKLDRKHQIYSNKLDAGEITADHFGEMIKYFEDDMNIRRVKEQQTQFQENNLEYDLRSTDWILEKVRANQAYAQNIYAALCNNDFYKQNMEDTAENILKILQEGKKKWSCSWRYAGGIVADMRQEGDYIDWYCSGIRNTDYDTDINAEWDGRNYVAESVVTDEVRNDLMKLGWVVDTSDNE